MSILVSLNGWEQNFLGEEQNSYFVLEGQNHIIEKLMGLKLQLSLYFI